jgi:hypothetical protein
MVTSFVFCQDFLGFFKFGHFFCPFLKNPKHFWPKIFGVLYNKFSKQLKENGWVPLSCFIQLTLNAYK